MLDQDVVGTKTEGGVFLKNVIDPYSVDAKDSVIHQDVYADLEVFDSYDENGATLFDTIDSTSTDGGSEFLKKLLGRPLGDPTALEERIESLKQSRASYVSHKEEVDQTLKTLSETSDAMVWFMTERSKEETALTDLLYFQKRLLKRLNEFPAALAALNIYRIVVCPVLGIVSPWIYFIVPYMIIRLKYGVTIPLKTYVTMLYTTSLGYVNDLTNSTKITITTLVMSIGVYIQSIVAILEMSSTLIKTVDIIAKRCQDVTSFIKAAKKLIEMVPVNLEHMGFKDAPMTASDEPPPPYMLDVPFVFSRHMMHLGDLLVNFRNFDWKPFVPIMLRAFAVDALVSVANVREDFALCDVQLLRSESPEIRGESITHLLLRWSQRVVGNDIRLGGDKPNNVVITGPNAGGKSSLMKATFTNILLSQTIGLASADSFALTPFRTVSTQMNVPDCKGKESLFEAEMNRCKHKLDLIKKQSPDHFTALAFDEIFSSTEPVEGIAGAYAVAQSLMQHANVITMITTHFTELCKLADEEDVSNMRMQADTTQDPIAFSYKLEEGISTQHIAIELLRAKGFDPSIIETALAVRESFKTPLGNCSSS